MAGKKRRHHYVPVFYLKGFCETETGNLFGKNLSNEQVFGPVSPKNVALKNDFYTVNDDAGFEDELSKLEYKWSIIHYKLIESKDASTLTDIERTEYARFIAAQRFRNRQFRSFIDSNTQIQFSDFYNEEPNDSNKSIIKGVISNQADNLRRLDSNVIAQTMLEEGKLDDFDGTLDQAAKKIQKDIDNLLNELEVSSVRGVLPEYMREYDLNENIALSEAAKEKHVLDLPSLIEEYAEIISSMHWRIIENKSEIPYVTTDNPVCICLLQPQSELDDVKKLLNQRGFVNWKLDDGSFNRQIFIIMALNSELIFLGVHVGVDAISSIEVQSSNDKIIATNNLLATKADEFVFNKSGDFTEVIGGKSSIRLREIYNNVVGRIVNK